MNILKNFINPPQQYRSTPYWVWNECMSTERITEQLEQFAAHGCGGVVIHSRVGLVTEYLSAEWFELWNYAQQECKRLELSCNIFDEHHYPPPMAAGLTPATVDKPYQYIRLSDKPAAHETSLSTQPEIVLGSSPKLQWYGVQKAPDTLDPAIVDEFLSNTYDAYQTHCGHGYGNTVQFSYNDEAGVRGGPGTPKKTLSYSNIIEDAVHSAFGFSLRERLSDLFYDSETATHTRFAYYRCLQKLLKNNFFSRLKEHCEQSGIIFTGHLWEHRWPEPFDTPNCMDAYEAFHWPGVDILGDQFRLGDDAHNAIFFLTLREMASAAAQLGSEKCSCELAGAVGYETGIEQLKHLADFALCHGVTHVVEHLSFQSILGFRKYDFPQTLSDHASWWGDYKDLADHMARLNVCVQTGQRLARTLVLHPTTTGWIQATPHDTAPLETLRQQHADFLLRLHFAHIDYDLGDELLMEKHASLEGASLRIGEMVYEYILIPTHMEHCLSSTLTLLQTFATAGGKILRLGLGPQLIDGQINNAVANIPCAVFTDEQTLIANLQKNCPPLITQEDAFPLPTAISQQTRICEDGSLLHILFNISQESCSFNLNSSHGYCSILNTQDGHRQDAPTTIHMAAGDVLILHEDPSRSQQRKEPVTATTLLPQHWHIERLDNNVLMIDYCDLHINNEWHHTISVMKACELCWQAQGYNGNPWRTIQYKRTIIDATFPDDSGFTARYHFHIDEDNDQVQQSDLSLALERPWLYTIFVNNILCDFTNAPSYLDPGIRRISIAKHLQQGKNTVELRCARFHPLAEIDRIYILGDFSCDAAERGFIIRATRTLSSGNLTEQGLPFYNGIITRRTTFTLTEPTTHIGLRIPSIGFGSTRIYIDGKDYGLQDLSSAEMQIFGPWDTRPHTIEARSCTTPRNLLGPHFWQIKTPPYQRLTGFYSWYYFYPDTMPAGAEYELLPLHV